MGSGGGGRKKKQRKRKKSEKRLGQLSARVPACPAREKKEETGRALRPAHRPQTLPFVFSAERSSMLDEGRHR